LMQPAILTSAQVAGHDEDDDSPTTSRPAAQRWPPASPPPSFHSRTSSPNNAASRRLLSDDPLANAEDRTLADTFDSDSDDDEDSDGRDDRQRLMRGTAPADEPPAAPGVQRRVTELPAFNTQAPTSGRVYGGGNGGVWANLSAKPTRGEDAEEKPPVCTRTSLIYFPSSRTLTGPSDVRTGGRRRHSALLGNHHPRSRHFW
jgi:hypothetical protein